MTRQGKSFRRGTGPVAVALVVCVAAAVAIVRDRGASITAQVAVTSPSTLTVNHAVAHDLSLPLVAPELEQSIEGGIARVPANALAPETPAEMDEEEREEGEHDTAATLPVMTTPAGSTAVEQTTQGTRPGATLVAQFEGLGEGFVGPQGSATGRNPSDNSLAVGPDHVMQIVNSRMAIFTKKGRKYKETGTALYGPVGTNNVFKGFGGPCEARPNGDAVARYDQLADRWLIVMPLFSRAPLQAHEPEPGKSGEPARHSEPGKAGQPGSATPLYEPPHAPPTPPSPPRRLRPSGAPPGRRRRRDHTACATRSASAPIRSDRTTGITSCGLSSRTIRAPPCGPTATTSPPAPATRSSRSRIASWTAPRCCEARMRRSSASSSTG